MNPQPLPHLPSFQLSPSLLPHPLSSAGGASSAPELSSSHLRYSSLRYLSSFCSSASLSLSLSLSLDLCSISFVSRLPFEAWYVLSPFPSHLSSPPCLMCHNVSTSLVDLHVFLSFICRGEDIRTFFFGIHGFSSSRLFNSISSNERSDLSTV